MFAITGITGQVGAQVAEALLADGKRVRAIVRDADKGAPWVARGCELAVVADATDHAALAQAMWGTLGVFLMNPPNYDPEAGFPDTRRVAEAYARAVAQARPGCVVALSSVGAQVERFNLLNNAGILEATLAGTGVPSTFLRPAWFMENAQWDVAAARAGTIESFLQPPGRAIDMVSVRDIGRAGADLLREHWEGNRTVELRGPRPVSPDDIAAGFAAALGRSVAVLTVPRKDWEARLRAEGMRNPEARIAMLDGFNEGWLDFAKDGAEQRRGIVDATTVLATLAMRG